MKKCGYYSLKSVPLETLREVRESRKKGAARNTEFHILNFLNYFTKEQLKTNLVSQEEIERTYRSRIGDSKYVLEESIRAIKECGCIRTGLEALIKNVYAGD